MVVVWVPCTDSTVVGWCMLVHVESQAMKLLVLIMCLLMCCYLSLSLLCLVQSWCEELVDEVVLVVCDEGYIYIYIYIYIYNIRCIYVWA